MHRLTTQRVRIRACPHTHTHTHTHLPSSTESTKRLLPPHPLTPCRFQALLPSPLPITIPLPSLLPPTHLPSTSPTSTTHNHNHKQPILPFPYQITTAYPALNPRNHTPTSHPQYIHTTQKDLLQLMKHARRSPNSDPHYVPLPSSPRERPCIATDPEEGL